MCRTPPQWAGFCRFASITEAVTCVIVCSSDASCFRTWFDVLAIKTKGMHSAYHFSEIWLGFLINPARRLQNSHNQPHHKWMRLDSQIQCICHATSPPPVGPCVVYRFVTSCEIPRQAGRNPPSASIAAPARCSAPGTTRATRWKGRPSRHRTGREFTPKFDATRAPGIRPASTPRPSRTNVPSRSIHFPA